MKKFEDLQFMSIGCNCALIGCIKKEDRIKGPVDNVAIKSFNGFKLALENKIYDFVKTAKYTTRNKKPGEYRDGDCTVVTTFQDNTIEFLHNLPQGEKFLTEFKSRCNRLNNYLAAVNADPNKWLILSLSGCSVEFGTGRLYGETLKNILKYLQNRHLLHKTIIIGTKLNKSAYKVFNYFLTDTVKQNFEKELNTKLNYLEIIDLDRDNLEPVRQQFKEKAINLINTLERTAK